MTFNSRPVSHETFLSLPEDVADAQRAVVGGSLAAVGR